MSVVRMELTVPDEIASKTANKLLAIYAWPAASWPPGCTGASVEVLTDREAHREYVILQAAGYFTRES